jgi:tetratricopeptide (TPR) repeat protein
MFWRRNIEKKITNLKNEKKYDHLLYYCRVILEKNPRNLHALRGQIFALQKQGREKEAIEYCNEVLELFPYDPDIVNCITNLKKEQGKNG